MSLSEHEIQKQCIQWVRLNERRIKPLRLLYATPNGDKRSVRAGKRLKAEGVKAGVWDISLDYPSNGYHGLKIEMKKPAPNKTYLSKSQKEMKELYEWAGYKTAVCRSLEEFINVIKEYLK